MAFVENIQDQSNAIDLLPDTQEILTEDESQSMYAEPLCTASTWAKLLYIPSKNFSLGKSK